MGIEYDDESDDGYTYGYDYRVDTSRGMKKPGNIDSDFHDYHNDYDYGEFKTDMTYDYDDGLYLNNLEKESSNTKCSSSKGIMQNIEENENLRINRWSICSRIEFERYVTNHGGSQFCLYDTQNHGT